MVLESVQVVLESRHASFGICFSVFAISFGFWFWNPVLEFDGAFWNLWYWFWNLVLESSCFSFGISDWAKLGQFWNQSGLVLESVWHSFGIYGPVLHFSFGIWATGFGIWFWNLGVSFGI